MENDKKTNVIVGIRNDLEEKFRKSKHYREYGSIKKLEEMSGASREEVHASIARTLITPEKMDERLEAFIATLKATRSSKLIAVGKWLQQMHHAKSIPVSYEVAVAEEVLNNTTKSDYSSGVRITGSVKTTYKEIQSIRKRSVKIQAKHVKSLSSYKKLRAFYISQLHNVLAEMRKLMSRAEEYYHGYIYSGNKEHFYEELYYQSPEYKASFDRLVSNFGIMNLLSDAEERKLR